MARTKITTPTVNLVNEGSEKMRSYGMETLKNRSIPSVIDGLKPVQRRILWSMYEARLKPDGGYKKASKVVGDCMGNYHPHGDSSIEEAMKTMVSQTTSPIDGHGNWGTLTDGAAASRYIECRLSKYGWDNFFNPDYIGTISMDENYDGSRQEPINLFSNTLNLLVNGSSGIAVGAIVNIPSFTLKSVNQCIRLAIKGKLTPAQAAKYLQIELRYGGKVVDSKSNKDAMLKLMKDGAASLDLEPVYSIKGNQISFTGFPSSLRTGTTLIRAAEIPGVDLFEDLSDIKTGHVMRYTVRATQGRTQKQVMEALIKRFSSREAFKVSYLTERTDKQGNVSIEFYQSGIIEMIQTWVDWRRDAEKQSIKLKIDALNKSKARLDLLKLAHDNRKVLDDCRDKPDPAKYLQTKLKVDKDGSSFLLGLTVRELTSIAKRDLIKERKDVIKSIKDRKKDLKRIDAILDTIFKG